MRYKNKNKPHKTTEKKEYQEKNHFNVILEII